MMYQDRIEYYHKLREEFGGVILSYITSDRAGFETQIAQDVIDIFIDQLDKIGIVDKIVLYLYTRGGETAAAWNIVNLLRMYCDELIVIVPHKAHSAGTIITLGADTIVMTKQATLSPIDPSLLTPLNPAIPNDPMNRVLPVSVEAVKGYLELAREEFSINDCASRSDILIKLSEYVHPLVLGQVYRSRAQIKMLAEKLLKHQNLKNKQVAKVIEFLCSDSGSHDYTINRREAKNELHLAIENPTDTQYEIIKTIYDSFSEELGFGQVFNPIIGAYSVRRGFVESIEGGSDYFVTEGRIEQVVIPNGSSEIQNTTVFEGWRHDSTPDIPKEVQVVLSKGSVQYEQVDDFKL